MQQVVGGFIIKKNKLLFGKRSKRKKWAPGKWDIVGGHALAGEDMLDAIKRETLEETGITVLSARLMTSINLHDKRKGEDFGYHIYIITSWKGKACNASKEHSKIRWFTREQVAKRKLALPEYLQLLDEWFGS